MNKRVIWYALISLLFILFVVFFSEEVIGYFKDFNNLKQPFNPPPNNRFKRPSAGFKPEFLLILFFALGTSSKLVVEWYKADKERVVADSQKVNSELSFLRAQLNPHFLFNTLNNIYSLANKKSENTTVAIVKLSELMRYMIYEANEEQISLEKEIEYIKNYISLQLLRIKDASGVQINIHGNLRYKIEPLLLISFIENAFKYGTDYRGKTDIRITISVVDNELLFETINTVSSHKTASKNSGIGLENIQNRLKLLYPKTHTLTVAKNDNSFKVNLSLKLKK
ncbi:sensor histidine kinase [Polaribacter sp.]|nr:sensor histidine kinase [Polaribacter sp.]